AEATGGVLVQQRPTDGDVAEGSGPGRGLDDRAGAARGGEPRDQLTPAGPFEARNSTRSSRPGVSSPTARTRSFRSPARRRLPNESTYTIELSRTPSRTSGCSQPRANGQAGAMVGPTSAKSSPMARCAATGEKMSRPWNVVLVRSSIQ